MAWRKYLESVAISSIGWWRKLKAMKKYQWREMTAIWYRLSCS
jgi:hypothetical protein